MIYYKNDLVDILLFLFVNLLIKGVPIWILSGSVIRQRDIQVGFILLGIYFAYLAWNNKLVHNNVFYAQLRAIQTNRPITPIVNYIKNWIDKK